MSLKTTLSILAFASSNLMYGDLIQTTPALQPSSGNGVGAIQPLFSVSGQGNATTESGCTGFDGTTVTTSCAGLGGVFVGGDNNPNSGVQNNVYTMSQLGLNNFDSLQLIFNAIEPSGNSITIDKLAVVLYSSTGSVIGTFSTPSAITLNSTLSGQGNAGFGFKLDETQAAQANALIAANPNLRIGAALNASDVAAGAETLYARTINNGGVIPPSEVPEPATYAGVGLALVGVALLRQRKG